MHNPNTSWSTSQAKEYKGEFVAQVRRSNYEDYIGHSKRNLPRALDRRDVRPDCFCTAADGVSGKHVVIAEHQNAQYAVFTTGRISQAPSEPPEVNDAPLRAAVTSEDNEYYRHRFQYFRIKHLVQ